MRSFTIILSLFVLILSILPCTDYHGCDALSGAVEQTDAHDHDAAPHDHSSDSEEHQDHCTPFCTCQCCGVSYTINTLQLFTRMIVTPENTATAIYAFSHNRSHINSVWRPPAIG